MQSSPRGYRNTVGEGSFLRSIIRRLEANLALVNNPILFIDVNGDSLGLNFIGSHQEHAENELYGIVNKALEGQFVMSPDSKKNLQLVALDGGSYDNLTKQGKAVHDKLSSVMNSPNQVDIDVDYASSIVHVGDFPTSTIDVADILQYNEDKTELGGTQIGKVIHEVVEQSLKRYGFHGGAHSGGIKAEDAVNGSTRSDSKDYYGVTSYTRGNETKSVRLSYKHSGTFKSWGMSYNRKVVKVTPFKIP